MSSRKRMRAVSMPVGCAAIRMAQLVGQYFEANGRFDEAKSEVKSTSENDRLDRASTMAFRMAIAARDALVVTPATSMPGAFAKIVAAVGLFEDAVDATDEYRKNDALHCAYALIDDVMTYFEQAHGITPASVGLGEFYNEYRLPMREIAKGVEAQS